MSNQFYRIKDMIVIEKFDEGALVLRMPDRIIFHFNLTALKVLDLTDGKRDVQAVSAIIANAYHISQNEAVKDVLTFYNHLLDQNIVEQVN